MRLFIWVLRILATGLFGLIIFPFGFNTFFGHGDTVAWSETYLYLVVLLVSAYALKLAWMQEPTKWHVAGGLAVVLGMLAALMAVGVLGALDT